MATFTLHRRDLVLSDAMRKALDGSVTDESGKARPGQLRKLGDWYFLTWLKIQKVKDFDPATFELETREIDSVRFTAFKLEKGGKLLVRGAKSGVREIQEYLNALTLQVAEAAKESTIQYDNFYKLREVEIDLAQLAARFEAKGVLEQVKGLRIKGLEVKYGTVKKCTVTVADHGAAMKILGEPLTMAGVESATFALRNPEKTSVEIGVDGQVTVRCGGAEDLDLETFAARLALGVDGRGETGEVAMPPSRKPCECKTPVVRGKDGTVCVGCGGHVPKDWHEKRAEEPSKPDRRRSVSDFARGKARKGRKRQAAKAAG